MSKSSAGGGFALLHDRGCCRGAEPAERPARAGRSVFRRLQRITDMLKADVDNG
jgi:hypothetical protein